MSSGLSILLPSLVIKQIACLFGRLMQSHDRALSTACIRGAEHVSCGDRNRLCAGTLMLPSSVAGPALMRTTASQILSAHHYVPAARRGLDQRQSRMSTVHAEKSRLFRHTAEAACEPQHAVFSQSIYRRAPAQEDVSARVATDDGGRARVLPSTVKLRILKIRSPRISIRARYRVTGAWADGRVPEPIAY